MVSSGQHTCMHVQSICATSCTCTYVTASLLLLQILVKYIVKPSEEEDFVKASPCTLCTALP